MKSTRRWARAAWARCIALPTRNSLATWHSKSCPPKWRDDPERLARFRREARALAQLDHPNIVTIYSVEESDGVHFLTMELVEGQPLDRLICAGGLPARADR